MYIFAADLSLAYGMRGKYHHSWKEVGENGSKCFSVWESEDLVHWTEQKLVQIGDEDFGCLWAPDIIYDREDDSYVLHWSSSHRSNDYGPKKIYMFVKSERNPSTIIMLKSEHAAGPYTRVEAFDRSMKQIEIGQYEAPTAVQLADGRWCLFLDYYGVPGAGQGYVPFVAESMKNAEFVRSDESFAFPYGFKHGTILTISIEEYERIKAHDWSDKGWTNIQ